MHDPAYQTWDLDILRTHGPSVRARGHHRLAAMIASVAAVLLGAVAITLAPAVHSSHLLYVTRHPTRVGSVVDVHFRHLGRHLPRHSAPIHSHEASLRPAAGPHKGNTAPDAEISAPLRAPGLASPLQGLLVVGTCLAAALWLRQHAMGLTGRPQALGSGPNVSMMSVVADGCAQSVADDHYVKVVIPSAGGYDKLHLQTHKGLGCCGANLSRDQVVPELGPDHVQVQVYASAVNYADICIRWGLYSSAKKFVGDKGWPVTPGFECSGTVVAVGPEVRNVQPGDRVMAVTLFGAYASRLVVPSQQVFKIGGPAPDQDLNAGLRYFKTMDEAAGFLTVYLTAYYAAFRCAYVEAGHWVLVHSAAGGVGTALVQLCKRQGCHIVGVVGASHKVEACYAAGCDVVIDKTKGDVWDQCDAVRPEGFDAVFDANGGRSLRLGYERLRPTGKLVTYGAHTLLPRKGGRLNPRAWVDIVRGFLQTPRFNPMKMTGDNKSVAGLNLSFLFSRMDLLDKCMHDLLHWLDEGVIRPVPVQCWAMKDVAQAHAALESGQTTGKLVLRA